MEYQREDGNEMPLGFCMLLARDPRAMEAFTAMDRQQRSAVVEQSRAMHSREDMERFVQSLRSENVF